MPADRTDAGAIGLPAPLRASSADLVPALLVLARRSVRAVEMQLSAVRASTEQP